MCWVKDDFQMTYNGGKLGRRLEPQLALRNGSLVPRTLDRPTAACNSTSKGYGDLFSPPQHLNMAHTHTHTCMHAHMHTHTYTHAQHTHTKQTNKQGPGSSGSCL